jgi:hypothetical protein
MKPYLQRGFSALQSVQKVSGDKQVFYSKLAVVKQPEREVNYSLSSTV